MQDNNSVLGGRYEILNPQVFDNENKEKIIGSDRFYYFKDIVERPYSRVQLDLGKDRRLSRVVIIKRPKYRECDYESEDTILERRKALEVQIDLLNDLKSPLLPEPIDYMEVISNDNNIPYSLRKNEPVLVLDYQSGKTLEHMINRLVKDTKKVGHSKELARMREINRICKNIIAFLKVLKEKEYAYQALTLKHILLLKDNSLRFLGLGSICKTKNGKLDHTHKNFGVTALGYSAPELNNMSLLNWGADYATSESVGAFSLGVILHQLIIGRDLSYKEDKDIIGEHGNLIYPNEKTESIIKSVPLYPYKIHKLISDLCNEDPFDRLTDYDEILARLENIFENRRNKIKSSTNLKSISRFNLFNAEEDATNKHCILDNELLEECEVLVDYYLKGKSIPIGKIASKAYVCKSCNELSNYYIDTESYSQLQMSLEDKQNEMGEELEFKAIESEDIKGIDRIVINNESDNLCLAHERKLKIQKVAINYYLKNQTDKPQGKLYLDLPVCNKCSKAHVNNKQFNEINKLLSSKLNNSNYVFKVSENKDILPKVNKIYMLDKEFEHCMSDLHKLKNKYVVLQYIKDKVTEKLMIGLKYCSECDKYYINQHGIIYLNKNIPSNSKKLFTTEKLGITVDSVIRIFDKEKLCTVDGCKLDKKHIALNWYQDSKRTKIIGKIKVGAWICPHGEVYIKEETERRLNRLIQKYSGYVSINQPIRPIANTVRIINQNTDTCKKNHELRNAIIDIEYIDKSDNDRYLIESSTEVAYCDICKEAYLTDEEYDNISNLLDDNCYIDKKKNLIDIPVIKNILGDLFKRKK